jgi:flagellar basal body-associated protein FliL
MNERMKNRAERREEENKQKNDRKKIIDSIIAVIAIIMFLYIFVVAMFIDSMSIKQTMNAAIPVLMLGSVVGILKVVDYYWN